MMPSYKLQKFRITGFRLPENIGPSITILKYYYAYPNPKVNRQTGCWGIRVKENVVNKNVNHVVEVSLTGAVLYMNNIARLMEESTLYSKIYE